MATTAPTDTDAAPTSAPADETANTDEVVSVDETLVEQFMKLVSGNPQFREPAPTGKAFAIVGARPLPPR